MHRWSASLVAEQILDTADLAAEFPTMGRVVPEFDNEEVREVLIHSYRIIYRIEPHRILIGAVVHGARLLKNAIKGRSI